MILRAKYTAPGLYDENPPIQAHPHEWVDLRAAADVMMYPGDFRMIPLGICIELPPGYEALVLPRSSTFKNFGIILANGMGVIDAEYCGDNDVWHFPAIAMRTTKIVYGDRICQFRIIKQQPDIEFEIVEHLGNKDRKGLGSTGVR